MTPVCAQRAQRSAEQMAAFVMLWLVYGATLVCARLLGRTRPARPSRRKGPILVTGTFYNDGWFAAHARPLADARVGEVIFVTDRPPAAQAGVRVICPPAWLLRLLGRAPAKLLWLVALALRVRPAVVMGYHLFPAALSALIAARLCGSRACYQMTGGPLEISGGGVGAENPVLARLGRPSPRIERLALAAVDCFDLVVVRGRQAQTYLREQGVQAAIETITGSVPETGGALRGERPYDLAFVGRLSEIKQPVQFVEILAGVAHTYPQVRAVLVGDGPLLSRVRARVCELGLEGNVDLLGQRDDAAALLALARVFVLTSRSEGLSIAMAEAMAVGAVPVVADVGELRELIEHGRSGFVVAPNDVAAYVETIVGLLRDRSQWTQTSRAAVEVVRRRAGRRAVAERWQRTLRGLCESPVRRGA